MIWPQQEGLLEPEEAPVEDPARCSCCAAELEAPGGELCVLCERELAAW